MKINCWLLFLCSNIVHIVLCQPINKDAKTITYESNFPEYDVYHFSYRTENHNHEETGYINRNKTEGATIKVDGSYKFIDPEGRGHHTKFVADENGYRAKFTFNSGIFPFGLEPGVQVEPVIGTAVLATLNGGGLG